MSKQFVDDTNIIMETNLEYIKNMLAIFCKMEDAISFYIKEVDIKAMLICPQQLLRKLEYLARLGKIATIYLNS